MTTICTTQQCFIIMNHIIPAFGGLTAFLISLAPWKAVALVNIQKHLGELNPFPFPMMVANSIGWFVYSLMLRDWYVFIPNFIGYLFGIWYTFSTFRYATAEFQTKCILITLLTSATIFLGGAVAFIHLGTTDSAKNLLGSVCVCILIMFYSSPLSSLSNVIATRSAKSIDAPLAVTW